MNATFSDITSRIQEPPQWWDQNGTPRYGKFHPSQSPSIYSNTVALLEIECQSCRDHFVVEMHSGWFEDREFNPKKLHYGDPPNHGCVGDTMNCIDLRVLEVWHRESFSVWQRVKLLEGAMDAPQWFVPAPKSKQMTKRKRTRTRASN